MKHFCVWELSAMTLKLMVILNLYIYLWLKL